MGAGRYHGGGIQLSGEKKYCVRTGHLLFYPANAFFMQMQAGMPVEVF
jgi:hypothetical protein